MTRLADALHSASFRGVEMPVESIERSYGRRLVVHEFAGSDAPAFDDLGEKARGLEVRCVYSGRNWLQERDRLVAALQAPGSGEWMDPTRGTLTVRVESWAISEEMNPLGKAVFEIHFVEENPQKYALVEVNTEPLAPEVQATLAAAEMTAWDPKGDAFLDALLAVDSIFSGIEEAMAGIESGMRFATNTVGKLQEVAFRLRKAKARLRDVVSFPEGIVAQWAGVSGLIREAIRMPVVENSSKKLGIDVAGVLGSVVASSHSRRESSSSTSFPGLPAPEIEARILRIEEKIAAASTTRREAEFWREALGLAERIRASGGGSGSEEDRERIRGNRESLAAAWEMFLVGELLRVTGGTFTRSEERESLATTMLAILERALGRTAGKPEELEARFLLLSTLRSQVWGNQAKGEFSEKTVAGRGLPLLVLCYDVRGDLAGLAEIAQRNAIQNSLTVMESIKVFLDER